MKVNFDQTLQKRKGSASTGMFESGRKL